MTTRSSLTVQRKLKWPPPWPGMDTRAQIVSFSGENHLFFLILEASVKSITPSQKENMRVNLLAQKRTPWKNFFFLKKNRKSFCSVSPIPRWSKTSIDTRTSIVAASVEAMSEKVSQNFLSSCFNSSILLIQMRSNCGIFSTHYTHSFQSKDNRGKNSRNLSIPFFFFKKKKKKKTFLSLVNENERVWNIAVSQMNHRKPDPRSSESALDNT